VNDHSMLPSDVRGRRPMRIAIGILIAFGAVAAIVAFRLRTDGTGSVDDGPTFGAPIADGGAAAPEPRAGAISVSLERPLEEPEPPTGGFVGSDACAPCHAPIVEKYRTHPMWRSFASIDRAAPIEEYPSDPVAPPGPRRYRVEKRDGKTIHHEIMLDRDGKPIYDQEFEVHYAIGSGTRGRSYARFDHGVFAQSSIGWYARKGRWDLSPGYRPDGHARFSRRLGDNCLYCHAGRTSLSDSDERYASDPIVEEPIGCERCHGPGQEHVTLRTSGAWRAGVVDPIVNPKRLEPAPREDVCNQCHLEGDGTILRFGRRHPDFRPGQRIEDIWVAFVSQGDNVVSEGRTRAVSQVQQMRASRCYQASEGRFGCVSCHDPHFEPPPDQRTAHFRDRCQACHGPSEGQRGCSLAESDRRARSADDSCIECHMPPLPTHDVPHTAQTDHRVPRVADAEPPDSPPAHQDAFPIFDGAESRLPRREVERARGLAMLRQPIVTSDPDLVRGAQRLLAPRLRMIENRFDESFLYGVERDVPVLLALARSFQLLGDAPRAEACFDAALTIEPASERALAGKLLDAQASQDTGAAHALLNQLLRINPLDPTLHGQKALVLGQMGQWPAACAAAEQSLRLDPSEPIIRQFLAEAYDRVRRPELGNDHREILDRLKGVVTPLQE